ncbi:4-hydroxybenzoate polyprenyltransferase [Tropicimonas isoalkanivorans]|uniref:4-hydroxybenzoate polyprenyltransferase n=1 Tax=Tropicimonas isoalkanivorans TaxID=441112 RepID=A0A1I1P0C1_9RHOB|nr:UbiA family prenyltransferase [Tropicimonas isoalkanivorans]SFD03371.1 4-hydroxybenzoate polyprenyltransferase [Tropicimonas isoalkanivorans]
MTEPRDAEPKAAENPPVLAVDLDGTLIRSDMLLESWWNVAGRGFPTALRALSRLPEGKAAFKQALAEVAEVDVKRLPYNDEVLDRIRAHKEAGGRVALVTATDRALAEQIGDHLALFDEIHASNGDTNLKGAAKADFLVQRYGKGGYDYIADHPADLDVWRSARRAITVDAPANVRADAEAAALEGAEHLGSLHAMKPNRSWLRAMRPHQWAKNVLVFLPVLLAHSTCPADWLATAAAFVIFSMVASSVYLLNDLLDLEADRIHPRKRNRPLPSGEMALLHGSLLAPALLLGGLGLAALLLPWEFLTVLIGYYILTMAYSFGLKRKLVIDICTLAALYTVRIIAGGTATAIPISAWMLAFSGFLFLSLAAIKRQAELISDFNAGREGSSGRAYVTSDLPIVSGMALSAGYVAVLVLALYVSTPGVASNYSAPIMLWGICAILLYWISRAVMMTHRGRMNDDPVIFALKDSTSRICGGLIVLIALAAAVS